MELSKIKKLSDIDKCLFEASDEKYRDFSAALVPSSDKKNILGVRTPFLRELAAYLSKNEPELTEEFMSALPHTFFEENQLHAFLIEKVRDFDTLLKLLDGFLPYVDNWATCDQMKPKALAKHPKETEKKAYEYLRSDSTYTVRYGIGIFMNYFLSDNFDENQMSEIAALRSDEYYVNMMRAWYFATALAKQRDTALKYIENKKLDAATHNMTVRKAVESRRISCADKEYLRSLKI